MKFINLRLSTFSLLTIFFFTKIQAQTGNMWTSQAELSLIPMSGTSWVELLDCADNDTTSPDIADQNDNTNAYVLAAAIASVRYDAAGDVPNATFYYNKVVNTINTVVTNGHPGGRTLAWGREIGAYVLAADLIGYSDPAFDTYLDNISDVWLGDALNITLRQMFERRPNNWGSMGFGALAAIYCYRNKTTDLQAIRDYYVQGIEGPSPSGYSYGELSWQADSNNPVIINPCNSSISGMDVSGIIPDDMRRGDSFAEPPVHTEYPWEHLQGTIMAARILERHGMSIWCAGDMAIYRAVEALQVRLANTYDTQWRAAGDDLWMLPFIDEVYGTCYAFGQDDRMWKHGKNTGFPYVLGGDAILNDCGYETVGVKPQANISDFGCGQVLVEETQNFSSILWGDNDSSFSKIIENAGTYNYQVTTYAGCTSNESFTISTLPTNGNRCFEVIVTE